MIKPRAGPKGAAAILVRWLRNSRLGVVELLASEGSLLGRAVEPRIGLRPEGVVLREVGVV
jgi:hypothetical protein